uniref:Uncharacterized protein n=1 Tax=Rhizophora mucronata TaxID=61149 RepID=A0A2P2QSE2_RHIMU
MDLSITHFTQTFENSSVVLGSVKETRISCYNLDSSSDAE